jgi:lipopolysaccharide/colanic/teichoic acid biosynthesis glycosyltransferase
MSAASPAPGRSAPTDGETAVPRARCARRSDYLEGRLKRALDLAGSTVLLTLSAPLFVAAAAATKLDSPGPVLFRQERVGKDGRPFVVTKFRSMHADTSQDVHRRHMQTFMRASVGVDRGGSSFKLRDDPRVTRVGRILRRTSLDELPQLLNVIRGEMSLVGPRPAIGYEVDLYAPWQRARLDAHPGITGIWQVHGRSRVGFDESVQMDLGYIERASFWLDLKILLLSFPAVLTGKGAG